MKKRIIVLGGRGFVGEAICEELNQYNVYTFDRHPGDKNHIQGDINSISNLKKATNIFVHRCMCVLTFPPIV